MPNRLAGETSPYLLQHANNPVDWFPWGPDALARAKILDRPIFLSIGYAACHWCHVMERESFEHEATARYLNDHFVSVKVDREERPDLDQVYMGAVQAMTGGGGWPMSVFLTPAGQPFYGGTYYPDEPRHGMPSFRQVLEGVERAWREQRAEVETAGARLVGALVERQATEVSPDAPTPALFDAVADALDGLVRRAQRVVGRRAEVPAADDDRVPAAAIGRRRPTVRRPDAVHAREDGRRRHPRPARRRVPPLRDRPGLARAALRADALRQRAARAGLPACLGGDRRRAVPRRGRRRRSTTCSASSPCPTARSRRARTPTPRASRG